jgi:hypothetical protein
LFSFAVVQLGSFLYFFFTSPVGTYPFVYVRDYMKYLKVNYFI